MSKDNRKLAKMLKEKGLSCPSLSSMINKQINDAKADLKDAQKFRALGFNRQAKLQEKIANAQKDSANELNKLKNKVCRKI